NVLSGNALLKPPFADGVGNPLRRRQPDVGLDEEILKVIECRSIQLTLRKEIRDAGRKFRGCLPQARFQALKPAARFLYLSGLLLLWLGILGRFRLHPFEEPAEQPFALFAWIAHAQT